MCMLVAREVNYLGNPSPFFFLRSRSFFVDSIFVRDATGHEPPLLHDPLFNFKYVYYIRTSSLESFESKRYRQAFLKKNLFPHVSFVTHCFVVFSRHRDTRYLVLGSLWSQNKLVHHLRRVFSLNPRADNLGVFKDVCNLQPRAAASLSLLCSTFEVDPLLGKV